MKERTTISDALTQRLIADIEYISANRDEAKMIAAILCLGALWRCAEVDMNALPDGQSEKNKDSGAITAAESAKDGQALLNLWNN